MTYPIAGVQQLSLEYVFDPSLSGGIAGAIRVDYLECGGATIRAKIDVSQTNWKALHAANSNCTGPVTDFDWHIHTKWENTAASAFTTGCSLALTGNHYDPALACGPNSEHIGDSCKPIVASPGFKYACTPMHYSCNPKVCERGDLSGKLGKMHAENGWIREKWYDPHYPAFEEATAAWNMLLHATCGSTSVRLVCATATAAKDLPKTAQPIDTTIPTTYSPY
ncbi:hypothetical protein ACHHYP_06857 [Achlya hypogyna]|uniref:Uncharacterized protein n=1 Tax=Achlya hypogyna TaxID=1202772 RepID=A0A1V9YRN4_ACHHY|nr:hypothetical protein ACHHYP_06857 [Achlya hypogyna]